MKLKSGKRIKFPFGITDLGRGWVCGTISSFDKSTGALTVNVDKPKRKRNPIITYVPVRGKGPKVKIKQPKKK